MAVFTLFGWMLVCVAGVALLDAIYHSPFLGVPAVAAFALAVYLLKLRAQASPSNHRP